MVSMPKEAVRQLVTFQHNLNSMLDNGVQTDMVVLDFSKAIDCVSNGYLLRKLHHQAEHPPVDHVLPSWQNPEIGCQGIVFRQCVSR